MKVITFTNQKGGVGKTTSSTHFAHWLVSKGKRVAFLDADGQANASTFLKPYLSIKTAVDFFTKNIVGIESPNFLVFSASQSLFAVNQIFKEVIDNNVRLLAKSGFDYLIIDTSPSMSKLSIASLIISDGVFIPISMSNFSMEGVKQTMNNIKQVKDKNNSKVIVLGLIPNMLIGLSKKQKVLLGQLAVNQKDIVLPFLSVREPINDVMNGSIPLWNIKPMAGNIKVASNEMIRLMNAITLKIEELEMAVS